MGLKVLVVEDDRKMSEILTDYLETDGYEVLTARDGTEALALFDYEDIQLVLLDLMLPGLDGWTVCRRIRERSNVLIFIISARSEEDDKLLGYELGADEYITKPFSPKVLLAGMKALLKRNSMEHIPEGIIRRREITINKEAYSVTLSGMELPLTAKEYELLLLMAENPGKAFRREILINTIWGYDYYGDGRVVDTNIKTLRRKLGSCSRYIHTVIGVGYKFEVKP